jgi:hypothetical protein
LELALQDNEIETGLREAVTGKDLGALILLALKAVNWACIFIVEMNPDNEVELLRGIHL